MSVDMHPLIKRFVHTLMMTSRVDRLYDRILLNQGRMLCCLDCRVGGHYALDDFSFKVFSQWGEDGIIQFLIRNIDVGNNIFVELGVETFRESNCRFLMMNNNWRGLVVDGSKYNINTIRSSYYYSMYDVRAVCSFITRDNVSSILQRASIPEDFGILSVDIDGMDYFILEALFNWKPRIIIAEYNSTLGENIPLSVPYDPHFFRTKAHRSNLYYGANLNSIVKLLNERGYGFVGANRQRSNAFFVRRELLNESVKEVSWVPFGGGATFRESRGTNGRLTALDIEARKKEIADMPVLDLNEGREITVGAARSLERANHYGP